MYIFFTGLTRRRSAADLGATPSFHRLLSRPVTLWKLLGDPWGTPWGSLGDLLGPLATLGQSSGTHWGKLGDLRGCPGISWGRLGELFGTT